MAHAMMFERLTTVFREVFDNETLVITPSTTSRDVEDWDSLTNIRLMVALEGEFKIRLTASEIAALSNVGALAELIERKMA